MGELTLPSDIIDLLTVVQVGNYGTVAVYALVVYEWLLMFSEEYNLIHKSRWTSVKFAYIICRYYPLLVWPICTWVWVGRHELHICRQIINPMSICLIPFRLSSQGVLFIRAYAFTGRKAVVLILLGAVYIVLAGCDIWVFSFGWEIQNTFLYDMFGPMGCSPNTKQGKMKAGLLIVTSLVMDILSVAVVVVHCIRLRSTQGSLGRTFLQQGLSAFFATTLTNCVAMAVYFIPNQFKGVGIAISLILTNILACRLILLLRRRVSPTESQEAKAHSEIVRDALACVEEQSSEKDHWVITQSLA